MMVPGSTDQTKRIFRAHRTTRPCSAPGLSHAHETTDMTHRTVISHPSHRRNTPPSRVRSSRTWKNAALLDASKSGMTVQILQQCGVVQWNIEYCPSQPDLPREHTVKAEPLNTFQTRPNPEVQLKLNSSIH